MTTTKYSLRDDEVPRSWYNLMSMTASLPISL